MSHPTPLPLLLLLLAAGALAARIEDQPEEPPASTTPGPLVWQPLRASFRPLNRQPLASEPAETTTAAAAAASAEELEERPTRVPLSRFRPTRPPSVDAPANRPAPAAASGSHQQANFSLGPDCLECICEASTSCNQRSRCQTSDVRHTRCGLYLISYQQWLESGLSRQLVSREALARDAAADERAFYDCVTERDCAERLLGLWAQRRPLVDCDRDGRLDCYDLAALHQAGPEQCAGEPLLESQYWSDFNACFGFGRRR